MFLKSLTLTILISSLVLVSGSESKDAYHKKYENLNHAKKDFEQLKKSKSEAENLADMTIAELEKLSKQSSSESDGRKKADEEKIKQLEQDFRELYAAKMLIEKENEILKGTCKKETPPEDLFARDVLQLVKRFIKYEPSDFKFKHKFGFAMEKKAAEYFKAPAKDDNRAVVIEEIKKKFHFYPELRTWDQAREDCNQLGMYLPVIYNEDEQQAAAELLLEKRSPSPIVDNVWLGMYRDSDEWLTLSGEPLLRETSYVHWASDEPNNLGGNQKCVGLYKNEGLNDLNCGSLLPYICKSFNV